MSKLKTSLSSGPDGLPPILFKKLAARLAEVLSTAFTQLMSVGAVPQKWKAAIITPVFKKGSAGTVANYRPISLTCVPCKIMERLISSRMLQFFLDNNILHPAQHGFLKGRSTCTNLMECMNDWTLSIQYKRLVTVIYIDFSKAFDVVSHDKLLIRLNTYGITGMLLKWLQSFLSNRTHCTRIGSSLSSSAQLISGVIQGSGIGPLLFLTYINELAKILEAYGITIKFFADDSKMYAEITDIADATRLQAALDSMVQWAETWQLKLSIDKCCVLHIGQYQTASSSVLSSLHSYTVCGHQLPVVTHCRDLGVIIANNCQPRLHINTIVAKASQRANAILRCFQSRDPCVLLRAFKVYVRPILEFNTTVWSPVQKKDIEAIEKVQRRFTKRLTGLSAYSYSERLRKLNLQSLELRRIHYDLTLTYQIVFGLSVLKCHEFFQLSGRSTTRGHRFKLMKQQCRGYRRHFFTTRVVNIWNFLPKDVVSFSTLCSFKNSLNSVDFSRFLLFS